MILNIIILIVGLVVVLLGAEALVDGSSQIARRFGVSEFVIGLTIVALGTSAPEMVVSFISSIEGNSDIALGNIVGSNIFNTALILGLSTVICPIFITKANLKRDIPVNVFVTVLLIVLGANKSLFGLGNNCLSRIDGLFFLTIFAFYIYTAFKKDSENLSEQQVEEEVQETKAKSFAICILFVLGGLAALIFGGKLFVNSAEKIAKMVGMSDKLIAITVLAAGTSLPELATSVVAAAKGKGQLALGNILGSNTFNILLILGGSALIHPLDTSNINYVDFGVILLCSVSILVSAYTGKKKVLDRFEGAFLLLVEIGYMTYLIMS